jgi:hypothetical protein
MHQWSMGIDRHAAQASASFHCNAPPKERTYFFFSVANTWV